MTTTNYVLRAAQPNDLPEIIRLCGAHAAHEKVPYDATGKAELLTQQLFSDRPPLQCLVVERGDLLAGYATFMEQFSTWAARPYVYLDCVYLDPDVRGHGLGRRLMEAAREWGTAKGMQHMEWQTPIDNRFAIEFYRYLGATSLQKQRFTWNF